LNTAHAISAAFSRLVPPHLLVPLSNKEHARLLFLHISAMVLQFCRNWKLAGMKLSWQQDSAYPYAAGFVACLLSFYSAAGGE